MRSHLLCSSAGRLLARSCVKTRTLDALQRQRLSCLAVPQWAQGSQQAAPAAVAAVRWRGLSSAAQRGSKRPASKAPAAADTEGSSDEEEFEDEEEGVLGACRGL